MALEVREIESSEYERVAEVVNSSFQHLAVQYQSLKGIATFTQYSSSGAIAERDLAGATTYVALIQNIIIGTLQVSDGNHVAMLFVLPELQSRGVGRALVKVADAQSGLKTVNASVNSVMAYMRYGFMPCGADQVAPDGVRFVPMKRS
nr:GNAT family N-acetyltransferase [uncultured Deefgea sp.]